MLSLTVRNHLGRLTVKLAIDDQSVEVPRLEPLAPGTGEKLLGAVAVEDGVAVSALAAALQILEDLSEVVEMKINFPFEHLLLDCMVYSNLVADLNQQDSRVDQVESLLVLYLSLPFPEVRERFLRRLY